MESLTHKGTQTIETTRLILRRFTTDDAEAMYRNWANDPEVARYMTWEPHADANETRELLADWVEAYEQANHYHWVIVLKESNQPLGSVGLAAINEGALSGEFGYSLSRAHWGKGIMPEALRAVLRYLFTEVGFYRLHAKHDTRNPKSGRVMEKCGMQYEGTLRGAYHNKNQFADCKQYAILRNEI